jgi:predicted amidophosphoribosyltransferase
MSFNPLGDPRATEPDWTPEPTCDGCGETLPDARSNRCPNCWLPDEFEYEDFRDAPEPDVPTDFERGW